MADANDWNAPVIAEFRANKGRVGGQFEGLPLVLLHHKGRRSGRELIAPAMYRPEGDGRIYVFASKGGSRTNPEWYHNLVAAGSTTIEVGEETYPVTVTELTGHERDAVYAEQARLFPQFGDYARKAEGIRVIPVLALDRMS